MTALLQPSQVMSTENSCFRMTEEMMVGGGGGGGSGGDASPASNIFLNIDSFPCTVT